MPNLDPFHDLTATKAEVNRIAALVSGGANVAGTVPLRIIRGKVSAAGALTVGEGFTPAKTGTGAYSLTYTAPFSGVPALVVTPQSADTAQVGGGTASVGSVTTMVAGSPTDASFHFVAIGPA